MYNLNFRFHGKITYFHEDHIFLVFVCFSFFFVSETKVIDNCVGTHSLVYLRILVKTKIIVLEIFWCNNQNTCWSKIRKYFFLSTNEKLELNYQAWRIIPVYILICRQRNNTFNDSKYRFWIIHLIRILWNTKKLEFFYYRTIFLFWEINPIFFLYTKQELWTRSNQDLPTAVYRQQTQTIRIPHLILIL